MILRVRHLAALALLLSTQSAMADKPGKVAVGPGSAKGALLFNIPPTWINQRLLLQREVGTDSTPVDHSIYIKARPGTEDRFIVEALPPGQYWLEAVYQQYKWVACLESVTMSFSIAAGEITYLGTLDTRPTLASIQRNAQARKQLSADTLTWHFYRTNVVAPDVTGRNAEGLARAESFVRQHMPKSSSTPRLAPLRWGPHASARSISFGDRCGYGRRG